MKHEYFHADFCIFFLAMFAENPAKLGQYDSTSSPSKVLSPFIDVHIYKNTLRRVFHERIINRGASSSAKTFLQRGWQNLLSPLTLMSVFVRSVFRSLGRMTKSSLPFGIEKHLLKLARRSPSPQARAIRFSKIFSYFCLQCLIHLVLHLKRPGRGIRSKK